MPPKSARDAAIAAGRLDPKVADLRVHTARGTLINSAFQVGLAGLGLLRRVAVAGFLTRDEFGIWGILMATLVTLAWLKQVGIMDKYIQQSDPDQELAFQKAFTLELIMSGGYFVVCCLALPLYALAYGHDEIIVPGLVLSTAVILTAFQAPSWIAYRQMRYARQRTLTSVDPVVSVIATIALCAAGLGYWGLVLGALAGSITAAIVCVKASPYRMRLHFDSATAKEYVRFSWPLMGVGLSGLVVVQGALLATNESAGLAGVGAIGLAVTFSTFADRVGQIISQTIYPAVCAVADRIDQMEEVFRKSNRIGLMWALPFGAVLGLFADDFVKFVLGESWVGTGYVIAGIGVICGVNQIAFNWTVFMRAANNTKPMFIAAAVNVVAFFALTLPLTLTYGLDGYIIGFAGTVTLQIFLRSYFIGKLLHRFDAVAHTLRSVAPAAGATAVVLLVRLLVEGGRSPARALLELGLFACATAILTWMAERPLVAEAVGYVKGRRRPAMAGA